jgi:hypothetical protein
VLLLKTLFAPYLRGTKRVKRYPPLSPPETGGVPKGRGYDENGKLKSASKREPSNLFELPSGSRFKTMKSD